MNSGNVPLGYRGIYLEHNGESARILAEKLITPPEFHLSDEQLSDARDFEAELFSHEFADGVTTESIMRDTSDAPLIFAQGFLEHAIDCSGLPARLQRDHFYTPQEVYAWFSDIAASGEVDDELLRRLAKASSEYCIDKAAIALEEGHEICLDFEESQVVVFDPVHSLEHAQQVLALREYICELRQQYKDGGDRLDGAKRAYLDVYLAKINAMCVGSFQRLSHIKQQAVIGDNQQIVDQIEKTMPETFSRALGDENSRDRTLRRFDFLENDMGENELGAAAAVSEKLMHLAYEPQEDDADEALFSPEQTARLKEVKLKPEEMVKIFSNILERAGLLSTEDASSWSPDRAGRAKDGLFQVVINPRKNSFAVNGKSGAYVVASKPRSLYDVLVVGGVHELSHVNQAQSDLQLGATIHLAKLRGKRVGVLREGGANAKQRTAEQQLFGRSKPIALTYAKAYQALHETGSLYQAAQAFYNEKLRILPGMNRTDAAMEAADRVLRLKQAGGFSSAALAYAEEGILAQELAGVTDEVMDRVMAVTSFDLVDQVRLHKYGLLPQSTDQPIDWTVYIMEELGPYINEALAA